jgi:hypothetical protein
VRDALFIGVQIMKKLTKQELKSLANEIEALREKYLKRHDVLHHHLSRKYVKTQELYEQPKSVVDSLLRTVVDRLQKGYQMPTQQVGLLGKLQKMTTGTVKDVIKVIGDDQWDELTSTIRDAHAQLPHTEHLIKKIEQIGRDKFLNSKYYVPIDEVGSPRLRRVLQQYGVTITEMRMKEFILSQGGKL